MALGWNLATDLTFGTFHPGFTPCRRLWHKPIIWWWYIAPIYGNAGECWFIGSTTVWMDLFASFYGFHGTHKGGILPKKKIQFNQFNQAKSAILSTHIGIARLSRNSTTTIRTSPDLGRCHWTTGPLVFSWAFPASKVMIPQARWLISGKIHENPIYKWMMICGYPYDLGNHHILKFQAGTDLKITTNLCWFWFGRVASDSGFPSPVRTHGRTT